MDTENRICLEGKVDAEFPLLRQNGLHRDLRYTDPLQIFNIPDVEGIRHSHLLPFVLYAAVPAVQQTLLYIIKSVLHIPDDKPELPVFINESIIKSLDPSVLLLSAS